MPSFLLQLADGVPSLDPSSPLALIGEWAVGVAVVIGGSTLLLGLLLRGIQTKYGDSYVTRMIEAWYNSDAVKRQHTDHAIATIDNQIHRDDGVIRVAVDAAVSEVASETSSKIDRVLEATSASHRVYEAVLQKLSHIEGSIDVLKNTLKHHDD